MNTTSEERPEQDTPEVTEETQVEETVVEIDDTWVASVLAECDGDVAASIEWLQSQLEGARDDRLRALAELSNNQRRRRRERRSRRTRLSRFRSACAIDCL